MWIALKNNRFFLFCCAFVALTALGIVPTLAADPVYNLTLKDHVFVPDTIEVPADTKATLAVKNEDSTPEEFDSDQLHREKVIPGGKEAIINIGPLKPGVYEFRGEYHEATAKGRVVVK